jgi:recombination endonuclease VII
VTRGFWTCQRTVSGVKCAAVNANRLRKCGRCGKPRPARKTVRRQVTLSYEEFVELNGGEHCGICGRGRPESGRRLMRDHDHKTGKPRGLLCFPCNRQLRTWTTVEWMRKAIVYLERAERLAPER